MARIDSFSEPFHCIAVSSLEEPNFNLFCLGFPFTTTFEAHLLYHANYLNVFNFIQLMGHLYVNIL